MTIAARRTALLSVLFVELCIFSGLQHAGYVPSVDVYQARSHQENESVEGIDEVCLSRGGRYCSEEELRILESLQDDGATMGGSGGSNDEDDGATMGGSGGSNDEDDSATVGGSGGGGSLDDVDEVCLNRGGRYCSDEELRILQSLGIEVD